MVGKAPAIAALLALAMHDARAQAQSGSLPQATLGTWCPEKGDELGQPFRRCARGESGWITMQPHAMVSKYDHCRVNSVEAESAISWWVSVVCRNFPNRLYRWQFSRDGETLRLALFGSFTDE